MATEPFTDAIALLKADHRKVEDLFEKFEKASKSQKAKIASQICNELKVHTIIEEQVFYPALRGNIEDDTLNEAFVEHDAAKLLVNDIMESMSEDAFFEAKVKVLSEEIKHHVREEEMRSEGMFAQARDAGVDLIALRDQMLALKEDLSQRAAQAPLPPAEMQVVHV